VLEVGVRLVTDGRDVLLIDGMGDPEIGSRHVTNDHTPKLLRATKTVSAEHASH
jgi:DNA-nicking Smr family endonuclease